MFIDVRQRIMTRLLFGYDPNREIIEIQERGIRTLIDLTEYQAPESTRESDGERISRGDNVIA